MREGQGFKPSLRGDLTVESTILQRSPEMPLQINCAQLAVYLDALEPSCVNSDALKDYYLDILSAPVSRKGYIGCAVLLYCLYTVTDNDDLTPTPLIDIGLNPPYPELNTGIQAFFDYRDTNAFPLNPYRRKGSRNRSRDIIRVRVVDRIVDDS